MVDGDISGVDQEEKVPNIQKLKKSLLALRYNKALIIISCSNKFYNSQPYYILLLLISFLILSGITSFISKAEIQAHSLQINQ